LRTAIENTAASPREIREQIQSQAFGASGTPFTVEGCSGVFIQPIQGNGVLREGVWKAMGGKETG
jgi:hypothetical protein